jgi:ElaB/YqjD/DUF883 family membrane-anchored ribosome-binding protein
MDRSTTLSGNGNNSAPGGSNPVPASARVENAAMAAHQTVDKVADRATVQVDRLSGTAHRAVNTAADAATSAATWASNIPDKANRLTEAACTSIRARPIATVAGALVVGYLLGRLARL